MTILSWEFYPMTWFRSEELWTFPSGNRDLFIMCWRGWAKGFLLPHLVSLTFAHLWFRILVEQLVPASLEIIAQIIQVSQLSKNQYGKLHAFS